MDFIRKKEGSGAPIPFVIRESSPPGSLDDLISDDIDEMSQLSVDIIDRAEV
jgi:hypothetical protein